MKIGTLILCAIVFTACTETTRPPDPRSAAVRIAAGSLESQSAIAGTLVKDVPTVVAYDASGLPVAGAVITFAIESGAEHSASIEHSVDTTDADGIAQIRFWRVGTKAGAKNVVSARLANNSPISFSATVLPGAPDHLVKIDGDNQVVQVLEPMPVNPRVKVSDTYDNPIPNAAVTFSVTAGGGYVTTSSTTTDSLGFATAYGWTAGVRGTQLLQVTAGSAVDSFRATAVSIIDACAEHFELRPLETVDARLSSVSCIRDARYYATYYLTTPSLAAFILEMRSNAFDSYLELLDLAGNLIAANDNGGAGKNSRMRVLVPAGIYQVVASSRTPGVGGDYTLLSQQSQPIASGCDPLFVARGASTGGVLHPMTCNGSLIGYANLFRMHLEAGDTALISLDDLSYSNSSFDITDEEGRILPSESLSNPDYYRTRRFTADKSMDIIVKVSSPEDWAEYTIVFN